MKVWGITLIVVNRLLNRTIFESLQEVSDKKVIFIMLRKLTESYFFQNIVVFEDWMNKLPQMYPNSTIKHSCDSEKGDYTFNFSHKAENVIIDLRFSYAYKQVDYYDFIDFLIRNLQLQSPFS